MRGRWVTLEPLSSDHVAELREAHLEDAEGGMWRYLPVGPFDSEADYAAWVDRARLTHDPLQFAVRMRDGRLGGTMSLMRITPEAGTVETGWLAFAPRLQRTIEATEAVWLHMKWAFEAGYRRFEWKCDAANLASRRAAQRFGLCYEGVFRQAAVVKGRNRDTAWFAAIDGEFPALRQAFESWLEPANFDANGRQMRSLREMTAPILVARDPALGDGPTGDGAPAP
ncbi:GNAT family N-acetyltransferase [Histidinibacterium aquaticum]|uniref:GNAT family N-acetyltransferase n=1 Tax=Histidinibacterium aquaticum TaxID=2613962 RepID=A0A5J5GJF8_9RHOB|nr:GNAT family N-acetyltransferase [Histidinibacterium aquaticum]